MLEVLGGISHRIGRVTERAQALEELLTGLEVSNAQLKHERWKRQQNQELRQYQGSLAKDLGVKKQRYEAAKARAQQVCVIYLKLSCPSS